MSSYKEQIIKYRAFVFVNLLGNIFSAGAELAKALPPLLPWYHGCVPLPRCHHAGGSDCPQTLGESPYPLRPVSSLAVAPERVQRPRDGLCHARSSTIACACGQEGVMRRVQHWSARWTDGPSAPRTRAPCLFSSCLQVFSLRDPVSYRQPKASEPLAPSNQPSSQQRFSLGRKEEASLITT